MSLNVGMFECNTEIQYLDEPIIKLVFKLNCSSLDLANIFRTLLGPGEFLGLAPPLMIRPSEHGSR